MCVGMNVDHADPRLSTEQFGTHEHLPLVIVHPKNAKSKTEENRFVTSLEVENWYFMNTVIKLSFPTQILFVLWFVK